MSGHEKSSRTVEGPSGKWARCARQIMSPMRQRRVDVGILVTRKS